MYTLSQDLLTLRAQWAERYTLVRESVDVGEQRFEVYKIHNVDDILDEFIEKSSGIEHGGEESIPYWTEIWPSAIGLAQYLLKCPEFPQGMQGLEIGCGLGLAGMVAAHRGIEMVLTDYFVEPLELLKLHWWEQFGQLPHTQPMDWRNPNYQLAADLVIAADIAYEPNDFSRLLKTLPLLVKPGGQLILSEPQRSFAKPFIYSLSQLGKDLTMSIESIQNRNSQIAIYHLFF